MTWSRLNDRLLPLAVRAGKTGAGGDRTWDSPRFPRRLEVAVRESMGVTR